jgi:hypothetical protein
MSNRRVPLLEFCDVGLCGRVLATSRGARTKSNKSRKEGTTMTANLEIVVNNPTPHREERYPRTWLLYRGGQGPVEVRVGHDDNHAPDVLNNVAVGIVCFLGAATSFFSITLW